MSAEDQGSAAVVDSGPQIITVMGQEPVAAEVVETPAAAEVKAEPEVKTEPAGSEEQAEEATNRDDKGRFKPGVQTRIDELTRARREAEREAEYWRVRAQSTQQQAPAKEAAAEANPKPVRENYENDDAYLDALADHKVEAKLAERDQKSKQVQEQTSKADSWNSKLEAARTEIEGFDDIMANADAPVAAHVAELIMEHDHGPRVMHHFATNPEELAKLNAMSPAKAAFEIGRLATKFDAAPAPSASSSKPAAEVKVSKAPPPAARTVGSGRSTAPDLGELSMEDYVAQRKSQGASWAR